MPCEAQLLTQSQSLRHTYSPLAQLSSPEDFLQVQSTVECYGATFDFHEAQCLTIYIYIYMFISQAQVCDICIYMYIQMAPLSLLKGVRFIFINRIRPGRTQVVQDELVNHG